MARDRKIELDDLTIRAGTYFNPQTEVLVIVDDSPAMDAEIFNMEEFEGADWVLISDEVPVDESKRDELLESFQATYHGGDGRMGLSAEDDDLDDPSTRPGDEDEGDEDPLVLADDEPDDDD